MAGTDSGRMPAMAERAPEFRVEVGTPLQDVGGGLPAFAVRDASGPRPDLMAVQVRPGAPPRTAAAAAVVGEPVREMVMPV
ncbi:MAG: hypothetical protein JO326_11900, partial [Acetobacteraceae bacterium]|nr:hypothetical protein [Acetobacteraceae bacterium]